MKPKSWRVLLPFAYMAGVFFISSIPDRSRIDEPAVQISWDWLPELLQNALHVPLFGALALLWGWSLSAWNACARVETALVIAIAGSYAVLDELHQATVPGRQGTLQDVLLDLVGVITGAWIWRRLLSRRGLARAASKKPR